MMSKYSTSKTPGVIEPRIKCNLRNYTLDIPRFLQTERSFLKGEYHSLFQTTLVPPEMLLLRGPGIYTLLVS